MNEPIDPNILRLLNETHQDIRLKLGRLPQHAAPAVLLRSLHHQYAETHWIEKIRAWFVWPTLWKPVGALTVAAVIAAAWMSHTRNKLDDYIDMQPLVAAHSRYQAETLVPDGDMAATNFDTQLAMYYGDQD